MCGLWHDYLEPFRSYLFTYKTVRGTTSSWLPQAQHGVYPIVSMGVSNPGLPSLWCNKYVQLCAVDGHIPNKGPRALSPQASDGVLNWPPHLPSLLLYCLPLLHHPAMKDRRGAIVHPKQSRRLTLPSTDIMHGHQCPRIWSPCSWLPQNLNAL